MVSIIVPVFNRENYITKCVNSILGQTYTDIEVILVNDGSTDNSLELMREIALTDSRVKIIDKPNGGTSTAVFSGVKNSNGEYITFVDSDDYVGSELIQNYLNNIEDYDVVSMGYYEEDDKIIAKSIKGGIWLSQSLECLMTDWKKIPCVRWNKLYKKEILYKFMDVFGSLKISYAEDVYFNCLLNYTVLSANGKTKSVAEPNCYYYIINHNSVSHKMFKNNFYEEEFRKLIIADEIIDIYTGREINFSDELIFNLGNYYIKESKNMTESTKKQSVAIIKAILHNEHFQRSVAVFKPENFKGRVKKIFIKLKLAKLLYVFL